MASKEHEPFNGGLQTGSRARNSGVGQERGAKPHKAERFL